MTMDARTRHRSPAMPLIGLGISCALMPAFIFVYLVAETVGMRLQHGIDLNSIVTGLFAGLIAALFGTLAIIIVPWFGLLPLLAGAAAVWGGFAGSIRSLRARGVASPGRVTWRAAALGYLVALFGTNVIAALIGFVIALAGYGGDAPIYYAAMPGDYPVAAGVYYLLTVASLAVIGMLAWPLSVRRAQR